MSEPHALLSASGAERWLVCTPSARLAESIADAESTYADEGTLAHKLGNLLIRHKLDRMGNQFNARFEQIQEDPLYSEEMWDYMHDFSNYVVERARSITDGLIFLEQRLELSEFIPLGFGTVDVAVISPEIIDIVDLKYGKGVPVDSFDNAQLKVYALGTYQEFKFMYPGVKYVRMTIYQPRIDNTSTYEMSVEELLHWGYTVLKPTAVIAFEGLGDYIPGPHCQFCRAKPTCKAYAKLNLQLAVKEFELPLLTDEQVVKILRAADHMKKWITSVEDYALKQAVNHGKKWPGMKVVRGRSVRKYTDEKAIAAGLEGAGYTEDKIVNKKLSGIGVLSKNLTKLDFQKFVEPYLFKPPGSPTLVSEQDARPEYNGIEQAKLDFG